MEFVHHDHDSGSSAVAAEKVFLVSTAGSLRESAVSHPVSVIDLHQKMKQNRRLDVAHKVVHRERSSRWAVDLAHCRRRRWEVSIDLCSMSKVVALA